MDILIVDSSVEIIERMQQALSEMERVSTVFGAVAHRDGSAFFQAISPGVVLVDSRLRDNGAAALIREIKTGAADTVVVVLTNGEEGHVHDKLKEAGADLFFDKYHEFEVIPVRVNEIIGEKPGGNNHGIR